VVVVEVMLVGAVNASQLVLVVVSLRERECNCDEGIRIKK